MNNRAVWVMMMLVMNVQAQCNPVCSNDHNCWLNTMTQQYECVEKCRVGFLGCSDCYNRSRFYVTVYNASGCVYYEQSNQRYCKERAADLHSIFSFRGLVLPESVCDKLTEHVSGDSTASWPLTPCGVFNCSACNEQPYCVYCTDEHKTSYCYKITQTLGLNMSVYNPNPLECVPKLACSDSIVTVTESATTTSNAMTPLTMTSSAHRLRLFGIMHRLW